MATSKPYGLTLLIGADKWESKGATPQEALANLKKPAKIMSKGIVTITTPEGGKQLLLQPSRIKRLFFNSAGVQEILAKQLFYGLK